MGGDLSSLPVLFSLTRLRSTSGVTSSLVASLLGSRDFRLFFLALLGVEGAMVMFVFLIGFTRISRLSSLSRSVGLSLSSISR